MVLERELEPSIDLLRRVQEYQGAPEIIVNEADQILVVSNP